MYKMKNILIVLSVLLSFSLADNKLVKIIATANVHGEVDPCG